MQPTTAIGDPADRQRDHQADDQGNQRQQNMPSHQVHDPVGLTSKPFEVHRSALPASARSAASMASTAACAVTVPTRRPASSTTTPRLLGADSAASSRARIVPVESGKCSTEIQVIRANTIRERVRPHPPERLVRGIHYQKPRIAGECAGRRGGIAQMRNGF